MYWQIREELWIYQVLEVRQPLSHLSPAVTSVTEGLVKVLRSLVTTSSGHERDRHRTTLQVIPCLSFKTWIYGPGAQAVQESPGL